MKHHNLEWRIARLKSNWIHCERPIRFTPMADAVAGIKEWMLMEKILTIVCVCVLVDSMQENFHIRNVKMCKHMINWIDNIIDEFYR